ncbi:MAG: metalloregulator ArsR/SmtB family transcription factor [Cyanobacteriota bacterium]
MNDKEIYKLHADFCKFMSNPKRIEIIFTLADLEMCVEEIASKMDIRIPNVSQHLSIMRERGVVKTRRQGTKIFYKLSNPDILKACLIMRNVMYEQMKENYSLIKEAENEI